MKTLNRENYEAWVLEAFDFDELRKKEDLEDEEGDFYWNDDMGVGLDELTIGDGLVYRSIGVHNLGVDIELWKYKEKGKVQKKNHVDKIVSVLIPGSTKNYFDLLKFIPENIPDLQKEAEDWLGLKASINLEDWLNENTK